MKSAYGRSTITQGGKGEAIIEMARNQIEIGMEGESIVRPFPIYHLVVTFAHELMHIFMFKLHAPERFHGLLDDIDRR